MNRRAAVLVFLWSTTPAFADDALVITPACVTIDTSKDVLSVEDQERARAEVVRALERHDVLVVEHGCSQQYVLVHDASGVELAGPGRTRRTDRGGSYALLVEDVLRPDPPPAAVPTAVYQPMDADDGETTESEETTHTPNSRLYAQLTTGTSGPGSGFGYRRPFDARIDFDLHAAFVANNEKEVSSFGASLFRNTNPKAGATSYFGGGLSFAHESFAMSDASGPRVDAVAGLAWGRFSTWGGFVQAELALPLYGESPSLMVSVGGGR